MWDEKKPSSKAGGAKGGLGEGPAEGLSTDSMLGVPAPHRGCRGPEDPPSPLHR